MKMLKVLWMLRANMCIYFKNKLAISVPLGGRDERGGNGPNQTVGGVKPRGF